MQATPRLSRTQRTPGDAQNIRLDKIVRLGSGAVSGLAVRVEKAFDEHVRFGAAAMDDGAETGDMPADPVTYLCQTIEDAAALARANEINARPLYIGVPMAALMATDLAERCADAAARAELCPQEICLEIADSALLHRGRDLFHVVRELRLRGLRVGIDARQTWDAPLSEGLRLLLETVTIRKRALEQAPSMEQSIADADAAGMDLIIEGARWQDGPWLAELGVHHAIQPTTDS